MELNRKLYQFFKQKAENTTVKSLLVGIGYSAVETEDNSLGLSYTYYINKEACPKIRDYINYEGQPASLLLKEILSDHPLKRSMALALINALNYKDAVKLPDDKKNNWIVEAIKEDDDSFVSMVGYIKPLAEKLDRYSVIDIIDIHKNLGNKERFFQNLRNRTTFLIITSTSILNNTLEEILYQVRPDTKSVLIGPGTPLNREVFKHLPIRYLAGTVVQNNDKVLRYIRHGMGTRHIHQHSKKVLLTI